MSDFYTRLNQLASESVQQHNCLWWFLNQCQEENEKNAWAQDLWSEPFFLGCLKSLIRADHIKNLGTNSWLDINGIPSESFFQIYLNPRDYYGYKNGSNLKDLDPKHLTIYMGIILDVILELRSSNPERLLFIDIGDRAESQRPKEFVKAMIRALESRNVTFESRNYIDQNPKKRNVLLTN